MRKISRLYKEIYNNEQHKDILFLKLDEQIIKENDQKNKVIQGANKY